MKASLLKVERKQREWSQAQVAEAVGVSIKTVSRWEQGLAIPHPYYRDRLLNLFGKTAKELGLRDNADELDVVQEEASPIIQSTTPSVPMQALILADSGIPQDLESTNSLQGHDSQLTQLDGQQEFRLAESDLFLQRSLWGYRGSRSTFQPFKRFSLHPMSMSLKILLTLVAIINVLLVFILHPLTHSTYIVLPVLKSPTLKSPTPTNINTADAPSFPLYTLTIHNTDPSLLNASQHLNQVFNAVYPQLVSRFASDPHATKLQNVTLAFSSHQPSPAAINGSTITISSDWMHQHPTDVGLLTHELILFVEQYPSGAPSWFATGVADYARSVYGPADDDDWSLPNGVQPRDSYRQGGGIAARFLLWLEQHTRLDIVDQLNHALQTRQSFSDTFNHLTQQKIDNLWSQYQAHPDITLTPEQLYKTVISRKPVYQASLLRVRITRWHTFEPIFVPKLSMSNFAMQADMIVDSGNSVAGFVFRNGNTASYHFQIYLNGTYELMEQTHLLASGFSAAVSQGLEHSNKLTVVAQKHTIYLYINGQFIAKVDDSSSSYGTVGVMAVDETKVTKVRFENVQIF
ncbi:MAG TPA: basic secretory protein-like protein [Ktedonobacteraceae bacterium]|jgi:transcriptional regulator with XRE-family HTH domain